MSSLFVAAGAVLALRFAATRFLRRGQRDETYKDLFFADDEIGVSTSYRYGETVESGPNAPLRSHLPTSGLGFGQPEEHYRYENDLPGQAKPRCSLNEENLQALPCHPDSSSPRPGEPAQSLRPKEWTEAVDLASVSSGEARRRAASVRKVRDWDDTGGSRRWNPEPDGSRSDSHGGGGSISSGGEEERCRAKGAEQRANDGSSAAARPRRISPRITTRPPAEGSRQGSGARVDVALHGSSSAASRHSRGGGRGGSGGRTLAADRLPSQAEASDGAAAAAAERQVASGSSVMANCSRGSATDVSVPYRSCGTGTGTLTSSSSPDTSQSAELQELRCDTDSERRRQREQQSQQQQQRGEKQRKGSGGGDKLLEGLVAVGKAEQVAAVAAAASAAPATVGAVTAAKAAAAKAEGLGSKRGHLPPALRAPAPPNVPPPPPPLPPTIVATRPPDPESLLAIQRQVDALRLQHLQRQAQALLAVPASSRAAPLTAVGGAVATPQRSHSPGSAWGGSAGSAVSAGAGTGGGGGLSIVGTSVSRAASPCLSSSGGWGGEQQWTSLSSDRGSPTSGLPPALRQQVDQMLQDMARWQQQEASPKRHPQAPKVLGGAGSVGGRGGSAGGGGGSGTTGVAALSAEQGSIPPLPTSAFASVQQLLLKPQSPPLGQQPGTSTHEQQLQLQHMQAVWDASQGVKEIGQQAQGHASAERSQWPQEATQAARMGTLQLQSRCSQGAQSQEPPPPQRQQQHAVRSRPEAVAEGETRQQQQQTQLGHQLLEWQRLTGPRLIPGEGLALPLPGQTGGLGGGGVQVSHGSATHMVQTALPPDLQGRWGSPLQRVGPPPSGGGGGGNSGLGGVGSAAMHLSGAAALAQALPMGEPQALQQQQQWQLPLQAGPPRLRNSPPPGSADLPRQRQQQLFFSPARSLSPPLQPGQQPALTAQRPSTAAATASPPQGQRQPGWALQPGSGLGSTHELPYVQAMQQHYHHQMQLQAQTNGPRAETLAATSGAGGGSSGSGGAGPSAEALLSSPPSFRHHLKGGMDEEPSDSAKRTQDWINSTPTRLMSGRSASAACDSGEEVSSPVLRPHPPPPSASVHSPALQGSFPFMSSYSERATAVAPPPPSAPLRHSNSTPPASALQGASSFRRQDTAHSRQSGGGVSSHGSRRTSGHDSRHASVHSSRRESTAARRRREMLEVQQLQEKMANQPPPSALALLSARMLREAGEVMVPAPKSPGGRAFFVPLKHDLRLEMSERPSSVMSGSQATLMSEVMTSPGATVLPNSFLSAGTAAGAAGGSTSPGRKQAFYSPPPARGRTGGQHR